MKFLACALVIALVGGFAVLTASAAAGDPAYKLKVEDDKEGKITVIVAILNAKGMASGKWSLEASAEVKMVDADSAGMTKGADEAGTFGKVAVAEGTATVAWAYTTFLDVDNADVFMYTFSYDMANKGKTVKFDLKEGEIQDKSNPVKKVSNLSDSASVALGGAAATTTTTAAATTTVATTDGNTVTTTVAPTTTKVNDNKPNPKTGDNAAIAAVAGLMVLAGAAYVLSKKKK